MRLDQRQPVSATPARRVGVLPLGALAVLLSVTWLGACASERPRPLHPADDLHDPNPSVRVQAVGEVGRRASLEDVPAVIELLDDEDPAVRVVAGGTLAQLTGRDSGYRAYAEPPELRRQVEEWRAWWAAQGAALASPRPVTPGGRR